MQLKCIQFVWDRSAINIIQSTRENYSGQIEKLQTQLNSWIFNLFAMF